MPPKATRKPNRHLLAILPGRTGMVDAVVDRISELIADGKVAPGEKLPPEAILGARNGVSRTVIREAMRILAARGLVETRHGVGTIVNANPAGYFAAPLSSMLRTRQISIADLHGVRAILEVEIAGIAATNATRAEIIQLERLVQRLESVSSSPPEYVAADTAFHGSLAGMTHNPLLVTLLDTISGIIAEIRSFVAQYPEISSAGVADHRRIMECIRQRDANGARKAMRKHLDHARKILEKAAKSQPSARRKRAG